MWSVRIYITRVCVLCGFTSTRVLRSMRRRVGASQAPAYPKCYHLPDDMAELHSDMEAAKVPMFIIKPNASSRGRGIRVISHKHEIPRARK
jgi:formate-dependent phosphoribosylglycinamide formyltransferase (GAR transformylase)